MFQFLNSIGTWLSSACALGFAAFWGWSSVFLSPKATADTRLSSEAGVLLVVGLVLAIAFVGFHAVVTMVRKGKVAAAPAPQRAETAAAPSDFDAEAIIARWEATGTLTAGLNWYRANITPEGWVAPPLNLPLVQAPTMGVWSSGDFALTEQQMADSGAHVSGSWRYERIEGAGHWMQLEAPDAVNRLLLDFLAT